MKNAIYKNADEQHIKNVVYYIGKVSEDDEHDETYGLFKDAEQTAMVTISEITSTWTYAIVEISDGEIIMHGRIQFIVNTDEGMTVYINVGELIAIKIAS